MLKVFLISILIFSPSFAKLLMRVSTENTPTHIQTELVSSFVGSVNRELGDEIEAVHYHSGELFRDKDVVGALARGQVEMAVPGNWHLDKFDPKVGVFLLPSFYGLSYERLNELRDGKYGKKIDSSLEKKTGSVVLGRWIDLGYAHIYSLDKPIESYKDLEGMRIRVAGGLANIARIRALGANAVSIPWGDLPNAIEDGKIDGVLTTHETIASAKLWEKGISYSFEDSNYFPMYIPLVSKSFYERLSPELQKRLAELWEKQVDGARKKAHDAQEKARERLIEEGVVVTTPSKEQKEKAKEELLKEEPELLKQLGIDQSFVKSGAENR